MEILTLLRTILGDHTWNILKAVAVSLLYKMLCDLNITTDITFMEYLTMSLAFTYLFELYDISKNTKND